MPALGSSVRTRRSSPLAPFSRVTTTGSFIPEIDGLRFVAILAVLMVHLAVNLASRNPRDYAFAEPHDLIHTVVSSGDFGVQLFFIVSGFVLALPFARHRLLGGPRVSLKAYYLRRITRLEPPYIIVMVGAFLLLVVKHGPSLGQLFPHLLASLGYLHTLIYGQDSVINNVAWSLEVEIQFYLIVPWLTTVFAVRSAAVRRQLLATAIVVTSVIGPLIAGTSPHLENTILRFAQYFLVGFLLADLWTTRRLKPERPTSPRSGLIWDLTGIGCLVTGIMLHTGSGLAGLLPGPEGLRDVIALTLLPWICFIAYIAVFRGFVLNAGLTLPLLTTIGGMCYSIYLLHNLLLNNTLAATKHLAPTDSYALNLLLQATIMLPFIVAVSAVFFVLIERPCMDKNWPQRLRIWAGSRFSSRSAASR
jgi:peptidoglycan/LPS O-acetylase OafA/YrhL